MLLHEQLADGPFQLMVAVANPSTPAVNKLPVGGPDLADANELCGLMLASARQHLVYGGGLPEV